MTAYPYNKTAQGGFQYLLDTFKFPVYGEVDFYCTEIWGEEQLWTVPVGVTSISAVLIGGGGCGGLGQNQREQDGGGGGGLRWINGMPVTPGETLRICVGLGGTAITNNFLVSRGVNELGPQPGGITYISSTNNANVPGRVSIGSSIIVFAGAGSTQSVTFTSTLGNVVRTTAGGGGGGSNPGVYDWGTIGGGNGGKGGPQSNKGGGATDGGGGGAAGWLTGTTGGDGGFYALGNEADDPPKNGAAGGGGGGMYTAGGGGNGAGGGGGTGVIWGQGPNGNGAQNGVPLTTQEFVSWGGQGGSYGPDGFATGNETFGTTEFTLAMGLPVPPAVAWNYRNGSLGNGVRGFYNSVGDSDTGTLTGVFPPRMGSGGYFGGGGGGADVGGTLRPQSGGGACGVVRIIYAGRSTINRNYPSPNNNTNPLSNWGFPTQPFALGGPSMYSSPNLIGSKFPLSQDTSRTY